MMVKYSRRGPACQSIIGSAKSGLEISFGFAYHFRGKEKYSFPIGKFTDPPRMEAADDSGRR
jgi:hypothetical protein